MFRVEQTSLLSIDFAFVIATILPLDDDPFFSRDAASGTIWSVVSKQTDGRSAVAVNDRRTAVVLLRRRGIIIPVDDHELPLYYKHAQQGRPDEMLS